MLGIGLPEILLILLLCLLLFDAKKLPFIARSLGRAVREFNKALRSFKDDGEKPAG